MKPKTTKVFAANTRVLSKVQNKTNFPPCFLDEGNHACKNWAVFFSGKDCYSTRKIIAEHKLRIASFDGNHIFRHCSRAKNARSQVLIDHTVSCSMEPIKYFHGRKVRMIRIRLNKINQRRLQTHPPTPLSLMYLVYPRMQSVS